jgi:capsular polysaccharide transport system ATP-binding protein
MIRLSNVSLSFRQKGVGHGPIMRNVSVVLPTDRRFAILGEDPRALTEVLSMLAGMRRPDGGSIDYQHMRCSPVVNASSFAGQSLVNQLTAIENIRLAACTHGLDARELIALVEAACQFGKMLSAPVSNFDRVMRRRLEATLIAAIPFDCYYIDKLNELESPLIWQFVRVAEQRGAGILFTSRRPKQIHNFAESGAMVRDGSLEMWDDLTKSLPGHGN